MIIHQTNTGVTEVVTKVMKDGRKMNTMVVPETTMTKRNILLPTQLAALAAATAATQINLSKVPKNWATA